MKNPRRKGTKHRSRCIKELKKEGWLADSVEKTGKFVKIKDMLGLFDVFAIHPMKGIKLIQITSNRPHTHKPYTYFSIDYSNWASIEQWVFMDYKGWKLFKYINGRVIKNGK